MRSKTLIFVIVAIVAAALVTGVVAVAGADQSGSLPAVSAQDLLARMAGQGGRARDISGEVAWHNGLLGSVTSMGNDNLGALPARLPLVGDGTGRIWLGEGGARIESQGGSGDQVIVVNATDRIAWVYDFTTSAAKKIVVTGTREEGAAAPQPSPSMVTPDAIATMLQRMAPYATVEVAGQTTAAGRAAYLLRLVPTASDTALGCVQAAVDGETYVPLQLQVFAKGGTAAVLQFGFTHVSYDPIAESRFDFEPPGGTTVTSKTVDLSKARQHGSWRPGEPAATAAQKAELKAAHEGLAKRVLLTLPQAQELLPFDLAWAHDYAARPFQWAAVVAEGGPLTAVGKPLEALMGAPGAARSDGGPAPNAPAGPTAVLLYGKGFGTIALAQTETTAALEKQLEQLPAVVETVTLNGVRVRTFVTPLAAVHVWQQGNTTLVAGGMVTSADLEAFTLSVR